MAFCVKAIPILCIRTPGQKSRAGQFNKWNKGPERNLVKSFMNDAASVHAGPTPASHKTALSENRRGLLVAPLLAHFSLSHSFLVVWYHTSDTLSYRIRS